jgi:hypothetical protein
MLKAKVNLFQAIALKQQQPLRHIQTILSHATTVIQFNGTFDPPSINCINSFLSTNSSYLLLSSLESSKEKRDYTSLLIDIYHYCNNINSVISEASNYIKLIPTQLFLCEIHKLEYVFMNADDINLSAMKKCAEDSYSTFSSMIEKQITIPKKQSVLLNELKLMLRNSLKCIISNHRSVLSANPQKLKECLCLLNDLTNKLCSKTHYRPIFSSILEEIEIFQSISLMHILVDTAKAFVGCIASDSSCSLEIIYTAYQQLRERYEFIENNELKDTMKNNVFNPLLNFFVKQVSSTISKSKSCLSFFEDCIAAYEIYSLLKECLDTKAIYSKQLKSAKEKINSKIDSLSINVIQHDNSNSPLFVKNTVKNIKSKYAHIYKKITNKSLFIKLLSKQIRHSIANAEQAYMPNEMQKNNYKELKDKISTLENVFAYIFYTPIIFIS